MTDLLDAAQVARELLITLSKLRRMAAAGDYPELLRVSRGCYRVRRADHEAWMAGRWTMAESARAEIEWWRVKAQMLGGA